jgi:hypothetical protein
MKKNHPSKTKVPRRQGGKVNHPLKQCKKACNHPLNRLRSIVNSLLKNCSIIKICNNLLKKYIKSKANRPKCQISKD